MTLYFGSGDMDAMSETGGRHWRSWIDTASLIYGNEWHHGSRWGTFHTHADLIVDSCPITHGMAEWRSGIVSALPCERPGFAPRTRLREIIPANNCTMQGQNHWGSRGSSGVMKLWVAWEVLRWLLKFRELCSGGFHPKLVTPPYHGFLNVNTPPYSQNSKRH